MEEWRSEGQAGNCASFVGSNWLYPRLERQLNGG